MLIQMVFPDKMVTYETFIKDLATVMAPMLKEAMSSPSEVVSQREAYRRFGQGNVKRWRDTGKLSPLSKRPGKVEYLISDLRILQQREQDYL
jgi:hypothetical protein